jgi:signal transduction histidine kinase
MTELPRSLDRHTVPVEGDLRLPKPPGVIRQFWYRHPRLTDALIAGAYLAVAVAGSLLLAVIPNWNGDPMLAPFGIAVLVLGALALLFRRSRPWSVLVVAWVVTLLAAPVWGTVDFGLIPLAVYALAVYGSVRAAWIAFGGSAIVGVVATVAGDAMARDSSVPPGSMTIGNASSFVVFVLIVVLVGINIGNRRRYVVALLDRAEQLARESDQQARLAAVAERSRIAREMHDIVSHGLTVMVTLAEGSAATAAAQPERASDAMRQVAETGRRALADMRRMLGVLDDGSPGRDDTPGRGGVQQALEPQPGIAELGGLIERFRAAGLAVEFSAEGTPPGDSAEQLTIYRLVQESLTNVLRHSPGAGGVRASVRYGDTDVAISVTNDGPLTESPAVADQREDQNGGHGILGMRERVALYGGTVESGPRQGGGWAVAATLRHDPAPDQPAYEWTPVQ